MSIAAYRATLRQTEDPRAIERRLLLRLTGALEAHAPAYDTAEAAQARQDVLAGGLSEALAGNAALWRALKHDLREEGNRLAPALRASLISIALWIERETAHLLAGRGRVAPLVAVNRAVLAGLGGAAPRPAPVEG